VCAAVTCKGGAIDWLLENAGKIDIEDVSKEMRAIELYRPV
jgi:hypothetical protein